MGEWEVIITQNSYVLCKLPVPWSQKRFLCGRCLQRYSILKGSRGREISAIGKMEERNTGLYDMNMQVEDNDKQMRTRTQRVQNAKTKKVANKFHTGNYSLIHRKRQKRQELSTNWTGRISIVDTKFHFIFLVHGMR